MPLELINTALAAGFLLVWMLSGAIVVRKS